jgi:lambda family phage portal protein
MAAFIKKGTSDLYDQAKDETGAAVPRNMRFAPGMVFDDLLPGEDIGTIDTNRPNTNLQYHRDGQIRAAAAGWGASYSSVSKNYNGTYSAQRQELVEQWITYAAMSEQFVAQFVQPVWQEFVLMARMAGKLNPAWVAQCMPESIDDALFVGQTMPWIDPEKEANAWAIMEDRVYMSGPEVIRKRGGNPQSVLDQQEKWLAAKKDKGLDAQSRQPQPAAPAPQPQPDPNKTQQGAAHG